MSDDTKKESLPPSGKIELAGASPAVGQQQGGTLIITTTSTGTLAPANTASGRVAAFRDIRRQLDPADLAHPGVQKLLLDEYDRALDECERLRAFETQFHDKDKRVEVLEEKLRKRLALDIAWGAGLAVGTTLITLASDWRWGAVGAALVLGAIAVRVVLK
jgi:hypothetical protein